MPIDANYIFETARVFGRNLLGYFVELFMPDS